MMDKISRYLAIDISTSHGRHVIGYRHNNKLILEEIYRFENKCIPKNGSLTWDIDNLEKEIIKGIWICKEQNKIPQSIGITTWGADYVVLDEDDKPIKPVRAYICPLNKGAARAVEKIIPESELYSHTGIQKMIFNSVYQLYCDATRGILDNANVFLMIPEYLNFILTGKKIREFTSHSTTSLLSINTKKFDYEIIDRLSLPRHIFDGDVHMPGTVVGNLREEVQNEVGFNAKVVLTASNEMASSILGMPLEKGSIFISIDSWSKIGCETKNVICNEESQKWNFGNAGGFQNRNIFFQNTAGLWIIKNICKELSSKQGRTLSLLDVANMAKTGKHIDYFDVNDERFTEPGPMLHRIQDILKKHHDENHADLIHSLYMSIAKNYAEIIKKMEKLTGKKYKVINIVGEGSKDPLLNKLIKEITGKQVFVGNGETTLFGNILAQISACEKINDIKELRQIAYNSFNMSEVV